jgi:hypothetical protein
MTLAGDTCMLNNAKVAQHEEGPEFLCCYLGTVVV